MNNPDHRLILPPGMNQAITRRRMIRSAALGALGIAGGASFLGACGSDDESDSGASTGGSSGTTGTSGSTGTTASGGTGASGDVKKVHFVYVGPPDDNGWSQTHDIGRKAAEANLGGKVVTDFTPSIGFDANTTALFEQLVADGNDMIIANTEYAALMSGVADANPDIKFLECDGHHFTENTFGYYMAHAQPAYLLGVAAGMLAPNGKISYIGAFPTATLYNDVNAMLLGARSVNPKATVQTVLVNTFFDPQKAAQAADALLSSGTEFLFGVMDEPTYLQKAEEAGVWTGYWNLDFRQAAPTKYVNNYDLSGWEGFYTDQFTKLVDGTWEAAKETVLLDCPLGAWGPEVPQEVQDAVAEAAEKLDSGELDIYKGPLVDNKGNEVLAEGETIDRQGSYSVSFALEGVSGV